MKKLVVRVTIAIAVVLLIVIGAALFFISGFQTNLRSCPLGHLGNVASCEKDASWFTFQNLGWFYSKAVGPVSGDFCLAFRKGASWLESGAYGVRWGTYTKPEEINLARVPCESKLGSASGVCYAADRLSANGNTHYYYLLAVDDACQTGTYFLGSKRALENGQVIVVMETPSGG